MFTYSRNDTDSVPNMLSNEELMNEITIEDMLMEFYFIIKSRDGLKKPIESLKKYITV